MTKEVLGGLCFSASLPLQSPSIHSPHAGFSAMSCESAPGIPHRFELPPAAGLPQRWYAIMCCSNPCIVPLVGDADGVCNAVLDAPGHHAIGSAVTNVNPCNQVTQCLLKKSRRWTPLIGILLLRSSLYSASLLLRSSRYSVSLLLCAVLRGVIPDSASLLLVAGPEGCH